MKLDPGMHIGMHLVSFGKSGVTDNLAPLGAFASSAFFVAHKVAIFYSLSTHTTERTSVWSVEISWITYYAKMLKNLSYGSRLLGNTGSLKS
jgi:hypothetical protein